MDCTILSSRFQRSSIQWQSEITSLASKKDSWTAWIQGTCFWKACLPGDGFWVRQMSGESWRICSWQARLTEWEVRAESSLLADFKSRRDDDAVFVSITIHLLLLRTQYHLRFAFLKCMFFFLFIFNCNNGYWASQWFKKWQLSTLHCQEKYLAACRGS